MRQLPCFLHAHSRLRCLYACINCVPLCSLRCCCRFPQTMRPSIVFVGMMALAVIASASCPNQCSGHGRCAANDKCECYSQVNTPWGNRAMYTGADCSQRTCPLGVAPDAIANYGEGVGPITLTTAGPTRDSEVNADSKIGLHAYLSQNLMLDGPVVTINVKITSASTFIWKYASDPATKYAQVPITFATRASGDAPSDATDIMLLDPPYALGSYPGNSQKETGIRLWFATTGVVSGDEFTVTVSRPTGGHWVGSNDNTLHQASECSNRGSCDSTTGKCKCFVGFGGEACQRTTCPNDCSGHGTCQDEFHFRADADLLAITTVPGYGSVTPTYVDAFDAHRQMGCKCDEGYRGPDCSLIECPSGNDPLSTDPITEQRNQVARDCSGRGICDYSVGQCKCFKGYFGERCESQTNFV